MNKITSMKQDRLSIKLKRFKLNEADESEEDEQNSDDNDKTEDKGLFGFFFCLSRGRSNAQYFSVQLLDETSAVLIPHKWIPESDFEDSDELDDGGDFKMSEVSTVVKDEATEAAKENKIKKKKRKKKKKNNVKGAILGKLFLSTFFDPNFVD